MSWYDALVREVPALSSHLVNVVIDCLFLNVQHLRIGSKIDCLDLVFVPPCWLPAIVLNLERVIVTTDGATITVHDNDHDHGDKDKDDDEEEEDDANSSSSSNSNDPCRPPRLRKGKGKIRRIQIHYQGWPGDKWDEWIELSDPYWTHRIAPPSSHPETTMLCEAGDWIRLDSPCFIGACSSLVVKVIQCEPDELFQKITICLFGPAEDEVSVTVTGISSPCRIGEAIYCSTCDYDPSSGKYGFHFCRPVSAGSCQVTAAVAGTFMKIQRPHNT